MLVVTRRAFNDRPDECRVMVGDDVIVVITRVTGGAVHVGIEAPRGVGIYREELLTREQVESIEKAARAK